MPDRRPAPIPRHWRGAGQKRSPIRPAPALLHDIPAGQAAKEMVHVSAAPVLALRGVSKRFGAVQALTDVELEIHSGEVVALVGDNGAGKSTLVKTIMRRAPHR